jgi:hypothetical protein
LIFGFDEVDYLKLIAQQSRLVCFCKIKFATAPIASQRQEELDPNEFF